jgi:predicted ATPase
MSDSRSARPAAALAGNTNARVLPAVPLPNGARWRVRLLGGLDIEDAQGERHARFPSRAIAALLARLALAPERDHAREELVELLWPGVELAVGRNRLRQALSTLKSLLEPAGESTAVLVADRQRLRVAPGALACDAREFEAALRERRWEEARKLYRGELMPGHYDDWVHDERVRLHHLFERLERQLEQGAALEARDTAAAEPSAVTPAGRPAPSAAPAPPAAPVLAAPQPLLPSYLTRWFGAPALLRRLRDEVEAHRLVTLLGPGGAGKTRLAVELAQSLRAAPGHEDGHRGDGTGVGVGASAAFDAVVFVSLLGATAPDAIVDEVMTAMALRSQPGLAADAVLRQALAGRRALIVLDNLEHLLPGAAAPVLMLTEALPQAHWLCTSRRRLDVDGERQFLLDALPLPPAPPAHPAALAEAAASPAVQLFVDRARAVRADFHLGARNASVVAALAHALGGVPLAIELAAARVRSFTPSEMLLRLTRAGAAAADGSGHEAGTPALDLLVRAGTRGARDSRHASMQAVIGWSWAQLEAADARLLAASTVFGGSFTAAALAFVAADDDAALRLDTLQGHSMLRAEDSEDESALRFALLPPVREYAAAQLGAEEGARLRARHRQWLMQWAAAFGPTPPLAQLRSEVPNLAAAMAGALHDGVPEEALQALVALRRALADVALPPNLLDLFARLLDAGRGDDELRSRGYTLLGLLGARVGRPSARADVEKGVALAPHTSSARARALHAAASVRWRLAHDAAGALALINEAKSAHVDDETEASLLSLRGAIAGAHERDYVRSEALQREAFKLWQQLGNRHALTSGHYNLAICATRLQHNDEALEHLRAACDSARALGDWQQLSLSLNVRGNVHAQQQDWEAAWAAYREAAALAWAALETRALLYALWNAPHALAQSGHAEAAARLMSFAATTWAAQFGKLKADDLDEIEGVRRRVSAQLGAERCAVLWTEGETLTLADAVRLLRDG